MAFDFLATLIIAIIVLGLGYFLNRKITFLARYSIPEPVSGGIVAAIILAIIYFVSGKTFSFSSAVYTTPMLMFFASIGLSANFRELAKGGKGLAIFMVAASLLVIGQNFVGVGLASVLGLDKAFGLVAGSITLTGGHGTGASYAQIFKETYPHLTGISEIAIASATYGLVIGGIIGGPVAEYLIKRNKLAANANDIVELKGDDTTGAKDEKISTNNLLVGIAALAFSIYVGIYIHGLFRDPSIPSFFRNLPSFVWVLFVGIVVRAIMTGFKLDTKDKTISSLGNLGLYLFLAVAILRLKLWEIADLALPILVILVVQTVFIILFVILVTFTFLGRNYDAAVMSAGHCGFGLGATPTAMVNMQSVTANHGFSFKAFLIIPLVGAFFIDIVNAFILNMFMTYVI